MSRREEHPRPAGWRRRLDVFPGAEEGAQAIEVLLLFALVVLPCFGSVLLLQEVLCEYLEVTTTILTSPFF